LLRLLVYSSMMLMMITVCNLLVYWLVHQTYNYEVVGLTPGILSLSVG